MSERKVLNKYFPPDFDPSAITRRKGMGKRQQVVRLMAPFSMRCNTCGEYIYKGRKFNARKETVDNEDYYGIAIYRFYIKCITCSAEITFKTDPKNTDYACEHGASRNFEPWREIGGGSVDETEEERLDRLEAEQALDPMAALENKTVDAKREMDILDALHEVRSRNARMEQADTETAVNRVLNRVGIEGVDIAVGVSEDEERIRREAEEDEAEVLKHFGRLNGAPKAVAAIELDEDLDPDEAIPELSPSLPNGSSPAQSTSSGSMPPPALPSKTVPKQFSIKRKADEVEPDPLSLLSDSAKAFLQKESSLSKAPAVIQPSKKPKTNSAALANKFGIKRKGA